MFSFNNAYPAKVSVDYDSLMIDYTTNSGTVIDTISLSKIASGFSNKYTDSSVITDDVIITFTGTTLPSGTLAILPSDIAAAGFTGQYLFDGLVIIEITDTNGNKYQYIYYNLEDVYYSKAKIAMKLSNESEYIKALKDLSIITFRESMLNLSAKKLLINDSIKYFSEIHSSLGDVSFFPELVQFYTTTNTYKDDGRFL